MSIERFIEAIRLKVEEGARLLESYSLRSQIEASLGRFCRVGNKILSPKELMIEITHALLSKLGDRQTLSSFESIESLLKPLKEIREIVSSNEFNKIVSVHPSHHCDPIDHPRIPWQNFLKDLDRRLRKDSGSGRNAANEDNPRRIRGFSPSRMH